MTRGPRRWLVGILAVGVLVSTVRGSSGQVRKWPSERPPKPLEAETFTFPAYEMRTLANGLEVVVVPHHEQPAISLQLLVRAGCAEDPPGKPGVANLVASLLDQGTSKRTAKQIADGIDAIGGSLSVVAGTDVSIAGATVMKDSLAFALDLVSEMAREPTFSGDELRRQLEQLRSRLRVSYDDPDYVATVVFERLVYGGHPYAFPGDGTPASIERITRDDLVRFHEQHFAPNNSLLAVVGDIEPDEGFAAVETVFGGWVRREVPVPSDPDVPKPAKRVVVIDKPDAVQTEIRVGHVSIARGDREYLPLDMAIRILGGEGANRVQQVLRTRRGLTYAAGGDLNAYRMAGDISVETDTRPAVTGEAARLIVDEFSTLRREMVGERELDAVKAYMSGSYPLSIETPAGIATKVLNALFYRLPLDELRNYRKRVESVSPDTIQYATRAHMRPDALTVVLVGNAAAFKDQLRSVGLKNAEIIPLRALDLMAEDLRKHEAGPPVAAADAPSAAPAPAAVATPVDQAAPAFQAPRRDSPAAAVIQQAVAAAGGGETLRGVRTVRAVALTTMHTPEGPVQTRTTSWIEYPSRLRVEAETGSGTVIQAYDDGHAWIQDAHGPRDAPDSMRDAFAVSARRDWLALLRAAVAGELLARALPDGHGLGGRPLHVVELSGAALPATRLYVDVSTGRLVSLAYEIPGPRGMETTTETFSDFRPVDGVYVPFKAVVQRGAAPVLERTLTDVVINGPIPAGLFAKPPATTIIR